jgi:hypothetical protein
MCRSIINSYNINSSCYRTGYDTSKTNGECEIFQIVGSMITNDALCAREIKSWFTVAKAAFNKKNTLFTSKLDQNLRKELVKCHIFYGVETWTLQKEDQIRGEF